jgi:FkbM family methyltransferase
MNRTIRLVKEFFSALFLYENFWTYYFSRVGWSRSEKLVIKLRNGLKYLINTKTNQIIVLCEIWNSRIYDNLKNFVHDQSIVIDIGANIGVFSIRATHFAKNVKVISYEPFPQNFDILRENIKINFLDNLVFPQQKAVAGKRGELELFFSPNDSGDVSLYQQENKGHSGSIKVPSITLEDVFLENNIEVCDFLKVDCEGAEEEILLNTPKSIFERTRSITLEWHYNLNKMKIEEFRSFLEEVGYETKYNPSTLMLYAWRK